MSNFTIVTQFVTLPARLNTNQDAVPIYVPKNGTTDAFYRAGWISSSEDVSLQLPQKTIEDQTRAVINVMP